MTAESAWIPRPVEEGSQMQGSNLRTKSIGEIKQQHGHRARLRVAFMRRMSKKDLSTSLQ